MFAFNSDIQRGMFFRMSGIWAAMPFPINTLPPAYNVTGTMSPDCKCNYFYVGEHNGKPYYRRGDGAFYLWWNTVALSCWVISVEMVFIGNLWFKQGLIQGEYTSSGDYIGIPIVLYGGH